MATASEPVSKVDAIAAVMIPIKDGLPSPKKMSCRNQAVSQENEANTAMVSALK